jgi:hypothetical protein
MFTKVWFFLFELLALFSFSFPTFLNLYNHDSSSYTEYLTGHYLSPF